MGERTRGNPCSHHGTIVQRKRPAQRGVRVRGQCTICRKAVGPQLVVDRNSAIATRAPVWLPNLKTKTNSAAKKKAKTYQSSHWKLIRLERLALDDYTCQSCGGVADEVHHLPSAIYGSETLDSLVSCCSDCNQAERSARITTAVMG